MHTSSAAWFSALALGVIGCYESRVEPVEPVVASVIDPTTEREEFADAIEALAGQVTLLREIPPRTAREGIVGAVEQVADALEQVPGGDRPALQTAASLMREEIEDLDTFGIGPEFSIDDEPDAAPVRRALLTAAGALKVLAAERASSALQQQVAHLRAAAAAIEPTQDLASQHAAVLAALGRATEALRAVLAMSPPRAPKR